MEIVSLKQASLKGVSLMSVSMAGRNSKGNTGYFSIDFNADFLHKDNEENE